MTNTEYENLATEFLKETGYMAPGKSVPMIMGNSPRANTELRTVKWRKWLKQKEKSNE